MLTTAGGLVFYGSQSGVFHAVDAETGEILYTFNMGTTFKAAPMTYMLDGKQYVVGLAGTVPGLGNEDHPLEPGGLMYAFTR
jgi:alcohol dehydrogenase (cytochrome c)